LILWLGGAVQCDLEFGIYPDRTMKNELPGSMCVGPVSIDGVWISHLPSA
jgi:hypothetical protein